MIIMTDYNKKEKAAFIDFIDKMYGFGGDLDEMYESIHESSFNIRLTFRVSQRDAFTIAFCRELDKFSDLRLALFYRYIVEKDRYAICHRLCDDYIKVDWLWDCIDVISYGRAGYCYNDNICNRCMVGELADTTILDYEVIPFHNYRDFYKQMR